MSDTVAMHRGEAWQSAHSRAAFSMLPTYLITVLGLILLSASQMRAIPDLAWLPPIIDGMAWPGGIVMGLGMVLGLRQRPLGFPYDAVAATHARAQFSQAAVMASMGLGIACLLMFAALGYAWGLHGGRNYPLIASQAICGLGAVWYGFYSLRGLVYLALNRALPRCWGDGRDLEDMPGLNGELDAAPRAAPIQALLAAPPLRLEHSPRAQHLGGERQLTSRELLAPERVQAGDGHQLEVLGVVEHETQDRLLDSVVPVRAEDRHVVELVL